MSRIPVKLKKQALAENPSCSICGASTALEVHHIIPLAMGGENRLDNLQVLCSSCHDSLHKYNRSFLTKKGIQKSRGKPSVKCISLADLLYACCCEQPVYASEVIEIATKLEAKKWIGIDKEISQKIQTVLEDTGSI